MNFEALWATTILPILSAAFLFFGAIAIARLNEKEDGHEELLKTSGNTNAENAKQADDQAGSIQAAHNNDPSLCLEDTYFYQVKPEWDPNMLLLRCKKCDKNIAFIWFKPDQVDGTLEITPVDDAYTDEKYQDILRAKLLKQIPDAYQKDPDKAKAYQRIQNELRASLQPTHNEVHTARPRNPLAGLSATCPRCHSGDYSEIDGLEYGVGGDLYGPGSSQISEHYHCNDCGYEW